MVVDPLGPEQIERFEAQGFLVVPGAFDPEEVAVAARGFDELERLARPLRETSQVRGAHFVVDEGRGGEARIHRVVWCGAAAPVLLRLAADPRLLGMVAQILGTTRLEQLINQAHFKRPGDGVSFAFHQDSHHRRYGTELWSDVDGRGSFLQTAIAVDAMTLDNGPLQFVPGSHRRGHIPVDPETGELPVGSFDAAEAVPLEMAPGDLALFGPFVIHGSGPNRSSRARRVFINGYAVPGANRRVYPGEGAGRLLEARRPRLSVGRRARASSW